MSKAYNPQADVAGQIERLERELKSLLAKRDRADSDEEKAVVQHQIDDLELRIRELQHKLRG